MTLPELSAKHPVSIIMIYIAVTVTGIISLFKLDINIFPDISIPAAYVVTKGCSLSADDMEKMVTIPVERVLSSVSGIKEISSVSKEGLSSVKLVFGWKENIENLAGELREKIDSVYPVLPFEAEMPLIFFKNLSEKSLITMAAIPVTGKSKREISRIIETEFKSRILSVEGVSGVRITGIAEEEIKIDVDYPVLVNAGLSLDAVTSAVSSSVFSKPAGKIFEGNKEYRIRAETDVRNVSDIGKILLPGRKGLEISDIADVYTGEKYNSSYFHTEGKDCIGIEVIKSGSSGLLKTAEKVKDELGKAEVIFRNDFSLKIIDDSSVELADIFESLLFSVITGAFSALCVLAFFYRSIKSSLIVIISLPLSLAMVFICMFFLKLSLNMISVTGLLIGTGMVFDNTIVVLDKLINEKPGNAEKTGTAVSKAVLPVTGSTITTVIIFLPLAFISGLSGMLFKDLAFTVIAFISASAVVSLTVPPAFYMFLKMEESEIIKESFFVSVIKSEYKKYLSFCRPLTVFFLVMFLLPLILIFFIDREIIPPGYSKKVIVFAEYFPGYSPEYYSEKSMAMEKMLVDKGIACKVSASGGIDNSSPEDLSRGKYDINTVNFTLYGSKDFKGNNNKYEDYVKKIFSSSMESFGFKTAEVKSDNGFLDQITGNMKSLKCILTFSDRKKGEEIVSELSEKLTDKNCLNIISGNFTKDNPEYTLSFKKEGFSTASLTQFDTGKLLYNSVRGVKAASLYKGGESETDILVRYKNIYTDSPEKISQLRISLKDGVFDPSAFTEIEFKNNYRTLTRMNRKGCFCFNVIPFQGKYKQTFSLLQEYRNRGLKILSVKEFKKSSRETALLFLSALILIYFFLGAQFESFLIPLVLMFSIPLSVSGSFFLLYITSQSINISSFLGILILTGTSVNTTIMIFDGRKKSSYSIKQSAEKRLIPATASMLTTVAALLPAVFQITSSLQASSAIALTGGLLSGSFSVLLIYPFMFDSKKEKKQPEKKSRLKLSNYMSERSIDNQGINIK